MMSGISFGLSMVMSYKSWNTRKLLKYVIKVAYHHFGPPQKQLSGQNKLYWNDSKWATNMNLSSPSPHFPSTITLLCMALQNISTWPYNLSIYKVVEILVIYQSWLLHRTFYSVQKVTSKVLYLYISPVPRDICCLKSSSTIPTIGASTSKPHIQDGWLIVSMPRS
jgi:hypothetical protein